MNATPAATNTPPVQPVPQPPPELEALCKQVQQLDKRLKSVEKSLRPWRFVTFAIVLTVIFLGAAAWCVFHGMNRHDPWACVAVYAIFAGAMVASMVLFAKAFSDDH